MPILNRIHFKEESVIRYAWLSLMVWLGRYKICTKLAIHMPIVIRIHFKEESVIKYTWLALIFMKLYYFRYKICTKLAKLAIHMPILNRITGVESEDFINMVFF